MHDLDAACPMWVLYCTSLIVFVFIFVFTLVECGCLRLSSFVCVFWCSVLNVSILYIMLIRMSPPPRPAPPPYVVERTLPLNVNVPCYYCEAVNRATPRSTVGGGGGASGGVNGNGQFSPSPAPATLNRDERSLRLRSRRHLPQPRRQGHPLPSPSPAARSSSTLGAAGGRRRPLHAPPRANISPASPPASGSSSQTRRKQRFFMRTPPGSSVSRVRPKTAGHCPLFVSSGAKARPLLIASSPAPLLVSKNGFLAGEARVRNVATSLSRGGAGKATSPDGTSGSGSNVASEMGLTPLVPGEETR